MIFYVQSTLKQKHGQITWELAPIFSLDAPSRPVLSCKGGRARWGALQGSTSVGVPGRRC